MSIISHPASGMVLEGYAGLDHGYDELVQPGRPAAPALANLRSRSRRARPGRIHPAAGARPSSSSARTASPTTSTAIRAAWIAPGNSIRSRWSSRRARSRHLEAGLVQRARLLEAHPRRPLRAAKVARRRACCPPELVFANPCFLRPCHGIRLPANRHLHLVAFDIGRGPDGDVPRPRRSHARPVRRRLRPGESHRPGPHAARDLPGVQRRSGWPCSSAPSATRLRSLAPHNRDNPRIVLLTPGPYNETYFEHAYLARYLGYTLVEGGDLTVRDQRLYLKLLGGLQPVDVRLAPARRRLLRSAGTARRFVPRRARAWCRRCGPATSSSPTRSAAAWRSRRRLLPFLPALCRHLLGEELLIPSVAACWCGDPASLEHVLANLDSMVVKAAFASMRSSRSFPTSSSRRRRPGLDRPASAPGRGTYVGQEQLPLSTTPVLTEQGIVPRHVVHARLSGAPTRIVHADARRPDARDRVGRDDGRLDAARRRQQGHLGARPKAPSAISRCCAPPAQTVELSRGGNDLPSRAADNLFWLGRYVQRAEDLVRLLRGILVRLTEKSGLADVPELPTLACKPSRT